MENLHDSPARYDEHVHYLKDPTAPKSKQYSTKQQAANEQHKQRVTLYHKTEGAKRFDVDEAQAMQAEGWQDEPFTDDMTTSEWVKSRKSINEPEKTPELELLRAEAKGMGMKVDKRWSVERLKAEMLRDDRSHTD